VFRLRMLIWRESAWQAPSLSQIVSVAVYSPGVV